MFARSVNPHETQITRPFQKHHRGQVFHDLVEQPVGILTLRDVVDGQEQHVGALLVASNPSSIDEHRALPDPLEIMVDAKVLHNALLGEDLAKQTAHLRYVPLTISKFEEGLSPRLARRQPESLKERRIGVGDVEARVQHHEGFKGGFD